MAASDQFTIQQQGLAPGAVVQLFCVDATKIGGSTYYWTPEPLNGGPVTFGGQLYVPYPVQAEGFEVSGQGPAPRPKLRVDNTGGYITGMLIAYGDLKGAKVTRTRTLVDFLDGQKYGGDSPASWTPEIYYINQKIMHNKQYVEWELCILTDVQNVQLPGRQVVRDSCVHTYRALDANGDFNYAGVTCPYTNNVFFTEGGIQTTDASMDKCGRKLSDCKLRFPGDGAFLPIWSFPGILLNASGG